MAHGGAQWVDASGSLLCVRALTSRCVPLACLPSQVRKHGGKVHLAKLDTDKNQQLAQSLRVQRCG